MRSDNTHERVRAVRAAAAGRWADILARIGLPEKALTKRNKPCPVCGGTDRFSFIDDQRGAFVCRGLDNQGGDGFALVMHWLGCDFMTALDAVADALGMGGAAPSFTPDVRRTAIAETPRPVPRDNGGALAAWNKGKPLTECSPAGLYLKRRGLSVPPTDELRHIRILNYWHDGAVLGRWPAMLARITCADGGFAGIHRTYLNHAGDKAALTDRDGVALPCKKLAVVRQGVMRGAAVRLFPPESGRLALAEGIETALAVRQGSGLPVWACVSAFGLEHVVLPDGVRDVFIFADNDASNTGQRAAERLRRRLLGAGCAVRVFTPSVVGYDWLNVLNDSGAI